MFVLSSIRAVRTGEIRWEWDSPLQIPLQIVAEIKAKPVNWTSITVYPTRFTDLPTALSIIGERMRE